MPFFSLQTAPWPYAPPLETAIHIPRKEVGVAQVLTMPHCAATPLRICPGKLSLRLGWVQGDLTYHGDCDWCGHKQGLRPSDSLLVVYMQERSPEAFTMDAVVTHYYGVHQCGGCYDSSCMTSLCTPNPDEGDSSQDDSST